VKKLGFLSFGHWTPSPHSDVRTASDALLQSIELAVAAEELGLDGAYFRVHHFARQLGSPFPLLAAVGARTKRIEIGTAVIDMRYENPMYMAEDAGAADIIAVGVCNWVSAAGSPEQVIDGWRISATRRVTARRTPDMARRHAEGVPRAAEGRRVRETQPAAHVSQSAGTAAPRALIQKDLRERIWWGSSSNATSKWAAKLGMNLQSSTLKDDETGEPLHVQQRKQIEAYREAGRTPGHRREPRVSVSRSIFAIVDDRDRRTSARRPGPDQVGYIDANTRAIFGRSYAAEPDVLVKELARDEAIAAADTLLLTIPNQLGVDYNAHVLEAILKYVAPELGWR
jgi:alkanesulfonate monooxygenase SsuD/methylene tetrahydromethanopterin reductase-like flavin-dependent oxidoreductase (luciferase family)